MSNQNNLVTVNCKDHREISRKLYCGEMKEIYPEWYGMDNNDQVEFLYGLAANCEECQESGMILLTTEGC